MASPSRSAAATRLRRGDRAFRHHVVGRTSTISPRYGAFWRELTGDSQLRWLGPEKGVIHISMAAIVNAVWDLYAKAERKPVWKLLADMTPAQSSLHRFQLHHRRADAGRSDRFAGAPASTKGDRERTLLQSGYPGLHDLGRLDWLLRRSHSQGVSRRDRRRLDPLQGEGRREPRGRCKRVGLVREAIGPDRTLMIDANQRWDVQEAIDRVRALSTFNLLWIEEPTSPDDVLGHATIARAVARSASPPASIARIA